MKKQIPPFKLKAWKQLIADQKANPNCFFGCMEQNRKSEDFVFNLGNLSFDLSRNYWKQNTVQHLLDWSQERELFKMLKCLLNGEVVNDTEGRPALHPHYRDFSNITSGASCFQTSIAGIEHFYNQITEGKWTTIQGKPFKKIVSIGIGGSDVSLDFLVNAIPDLKDAVLEVDFLNHIDAESFDRLLSSLVLEETLFIVISKSFTTQETMLNAHVIKEIIIEKLGQEAFEKHFIGITANEKEALTFGIKQEQILTFCEGLGGRFSAWGPPGLVVALNWGFTHFCDFLKGGHLIDLHIKQSSKEENLPLHLALLSILYAQLHGAKQEVIIPYQESMRGLIPYLQQVAMESNGKSVNKKGEKITYDTVNTVWGGIGNKAQHTFFQWLHQGTHFTPMDMIFVKEAHPKWPKHYDLMYKSYLGQIEALSYGTEKYHEYFKSQVNPAKVGGFENAYNSKGGVPINEVYLQNLSPCSIGELMAVYEYKYIIQGHLLNINSFDQFGVELGKFLSKNISIIDTQSDEK